MKQIAIVLFAGLLFTSFKPVREINLYDSSGKAVVYIDDYLADQVVYLWNGKPVGFLHQSFLGTDVYGFNGKHLGWFEGGFLRNNSGYIIAATKEASGRSIVSEAFKGLKDTPPMKQTREQEPMKPLFGPNWASDPVDDYLIGGLDK